jgi:hypothetical protein
MNIGDCKVSGMQECPECGEHIKFTIEAFLDNFMGVTQSGFLPQAKVKCCHCKKVFTVECTVNVEVVD